MGVILYEMLLSITPFCSTTVEDLFDEITNGTYGPIPHYYVDVAVFTWRHFCQSLVKILHIRTRHIYTKTQKMLAFLLEIKNAPQ